ncbi:MAG: hypothetical protein EA380_11915, partial [Phycisphaeraceae bacterium]
TGSIQVTFDLLVQTGDLVPGTNIAYTGLSRADASNGNFAWRGDRVPRRGLVKPLKPRRRTSSTRPADRRIREPHGLVLPDRHRQTSTPDRPDTRRS